MEFEIFKFAIVDLSDATLAQYLKAEAIAADKKTMAS